MAPHHPLYATYIFLPSIGVFVHPLAIPPELAPPQLAGTKNPKRLTTTITNNNTKGFDPKKDTIPVIIRGKNQKANEGGKVDGKKNNSGEVMLVASQERKTESGATFCKFKSVKTGAHHQSSSIETVQTTT